MTWVGKTKNGLPQTAKANPFEDRVNHPAVVRDRYSRKIQWIRQPRQVVRL